MDMWESYGILWATTNMITATDDELDKLIRMAKQERTRRGINYRLSVLLNEAKEMGDVFLTKGSSSEIVDSELLVFRHIFHCES